MMENEGIEIMGELVDHARKAEKENRPNKPSEREKMAKVKSSAYAQKPKRPRQKPKLRNFVVYVKAYGHESVLKIQAETWMDAESEAQRQIGYDMTVTEPLKFS